MNLIHAIANFPGATFRKNILASKIATIAALMMLIAGCGSNSDSDEPSNSEDRTLTVFAAASLTDTFSELGETFEKDHPGVTVEFNFAGSSALATQIIEGAPADVFAAADTATMTQVSDEGLAAKQEIFATNTLQIATASDNPLGIDRLSDLANDELNVVICAPAVPCGSATEQVAKRADVQIAADSEEQSVTDVLNKVISGEADAGLVYVTDIQGAEGKVEGVDFAEAADVVNSYPIAALRNADETEFAAEFSEFILGDDAQQVLRDAGFGPGSSPGS